MRRDHRLSRRLFLSELGRRTLAVTVVGSVAAACSSDDGDDGAADGATDSTTTTAGSASSTSTTTAPAVDGDGLSWERVDFGFVSAYVLARGNEVAIVDTGTEGNSAQIEQALVALGFGWDDVDHVIVTHAHGDHVGGLDAVLTAAPSSTGYAGVGDIEGLTAPRDLVPVTGGDEVFGLQILATPGHTAGHISTLDPETGLLVAGDAVVTENGMLSGPVERFSDDIALARQSVKDLPHESVSTILVGHGDPVLDEAGSRLAELAATL